jgi:hypothetical protein
MVEELLPASVALMTQVNMDKWIAFWLDRLSDKSHPRSSWSPAAFFHVAICAGTNHIFPNWFAPYTSWDNVVKRQLAGRILLAAILTPVPVASEDISAVELYLVPWQTVVK